MKKEEVGNEFISLKVDFAFKYVMKNKKVLKGFLGAVFKIPPEEIMNIQFRDTTITKDHPDRKEGCMDVRVEVTGGRHINVEMQIAPFEYWKERVMFYNFAMYVEQGVVGSEYDEFTECIHISVLDFNLFENNEKFYSKIMLSDVDDHRIFTDKVVFYMIELKKLKYVKESHEDKLVEWSRLINADSEEAYEMLAKKDDYLKEAVEETKKIKQDYALMEDYLKRKMELMDKATQKKSYYQSGVRDGKEEEKIKMAQKLLCRGVDIDIIIETTELSREKVEDIRRTLR